MSYFLDLFSPETYEAYKQSNQEVSGFRNRHKKIAERVNPGDKFLCYITKLSRWFGVLEVKSKAFIDDAPIFYPESDPFIVRFHVKPIVLLEVDKAIPIHEDKIWASLSFTRDLKKPSTAWTGKVRGSLIQLDERDGEFLEDALQRQVYGGIQYPIDEDKYRKLVANPVRRADKTVLVSVPEDEPDDEQEPEQQETRDSIRIQALLAEVGSRMGFSIWLPRADRGRVLNEWKEGSKHLLEKLPLNYNDTTLKTIENIDVLWLKGGSIFRAFEIEHSTSVYSGILRMADLLALQPNMDINIHIVAPDSKRDKVFQEIRRPVFSLLERKPLSEICTFISYDSLLELSKERHLSHLSDTVLDEYAEEPE
ncbi:MAG: EVE domain-containing protein [Nitrospira sp. SB0678_bin_10]|nr:EVE domain-containing protein [Nitrospira sp. SB0678_bin_10]